MRGIWGIDPGWGTTIVRISTGLVFAVHGYQKFAAGMAAVSAGFEKMAIPLPGLTGPFIAVLELVGGLLLLMGLATRWVALLFAIEMLVAWLWVKLPGPGWNASDIDRMLLAGSLLLFLAGPGKLAVDAAWLEKTP